MSAKLTIEDVVNYLLFSYVGLGYSLRPKAHGKDRKEYLFNFSLNPIPKLSRWVDIILENWESITSDDGYSNLVPDSNPNPTMVDNILETWKKSSFEDYEDMCKSRSI